MEVQLQNGRLLTKRYAPVIGVLVEVSNSLLL